MKTIKTLLLFALVVLQIAASPVVVFLGGCAVLSILTGVRGLVHPQKSPPPTYVIGGRYDREYGEPLSLTVFTNTTHDFITNGARWTFYMNVVGPEAEGRAK